LYDFAVFILVVIFSLPVFSYSAYTVVLLAGSLAYRSPQGGGLVELPRISVLLAVYNEESAVAGAMESLAQLGYPAGRLQLVLADDSTDGTSTIVDTLAPSLVDKGIEVVVSRRHDRAGYKAGALNRAVKLVKGDLVLLVDADSRVSKEALSQGIQALSSSDLSFVSFRVGHYNREENLVTRCFALFQDAVDGLQKMGSSRLSLPFSIQGGFVLARAGALAKAGYWREGVLAEDADLSCKLFASGAKGAYLSSAQVFSEDPASLRVWKRQAARVAEGWAQCLRLDFRRILGTKSLGPLKKLGLLLTLLSPFAGLSWLVVTLATAAALVLGLIDPRSSVFGNPLYVLAVTLPVAVFYVSGLYSLSIRKMLTARNVVLLPVLSYMISAMFTISAISFLRGLAGGKGTFFRTPKKGETGVMKGDEQPPEGGPTVIAEGGLSIVAVLASIPVLLIGQFLLGLSLLAFGLVTLKSMELSRLVRHPEVSGKVGA